VCRNRKHLQFERYDVFVFLRELAVCGSVMNHSQTESTIKHNQISKLKQVEVWLIILKVIYIYSEWMFTNSYAHYCWKLIMLLLLILYEVELVYVCFWILKLREKKVVWSSGVWTSQCFHSNVSFLFLYIRSSWKSRSINKKPSLLE